MKQCLSILVLVVILLARLNAHALKADSTGIELSMAKTKIADKKDLSVNLKIKSYQKGDLFLPKEEVWGYLRQHSGFFSIQVQRKSSKKYMDIPEGAHIDNYPIDEMDTLHLGDERSYKFPIQMLYHYLKAEYRVRVLVNFSIKNKVKDKYSKWVYFECEKEMI